MSKRTVDLRGARPMLDMPHAAYRGACRDHYYAEVGPDASSWSPFSKRLPICVFGIVFVRSDVGL